MVLGQVANKVMLIISKCAIPIGAGGLEVAYQFLFYATQVCLFFAFLVNV